jgi:hypothetical protein
MGRFTIAAVLAAVTLSGCNTYQNPPRVLSDQEISQLRAEVQAIGDKCRSMRLSGRRPGFVPSVQCSNPGIAAAYEKVDYPYITLLNETLARRLQLAERADQKKISEGDMLVEFYSDARGLPAMPDP